VTATTTEKRGAFGEVLEELMRSRNIALTPGNHWELASACSSILRVSKR
jgi:hypothetical protein